MPATRTMRRVTRAVVLTLALVLATPSVALGSDGSESPTVRAKNDAATQRFDFPVDTDETDLDVVKLRCRGTIPDTGPVTGCWWRSDAGSVRAWQVWKLPLRVEDAGRVLVAEVDADTTSIRDDDVVAPGTYLYAVLGLDGDGEIVARSRVARVRFRDPGIEGLRLECDAVRGQDTAGDATAATEPSIACTWSSATTAPVVGYVLYRSVHGSQRQVIARYGAEQISHLDTEVEAGVRYAYRVVGVDAAGEPVAMSRIDGAGWNEPERDRPVTDGRRDRDRSTGLPRDAAPGATGQPAAGDRPSEDEAAGITDSVATADSGSTTDAERDQIEARTERDRRDRPERGR